ncbi:hypothetical protein AACH06_14305 [Ideonella sp. DXS29W]|uniref:Uncharacterized protein n=1 Tax=Ideonella lacteola TaxID=2984193 RepID=A0ABU9BQD5_9BURK
MRTLACIAAVSLSTCMAGVSAIAEIVAPAPSAAAGYTRKDVNITYVAKQDGFVVAKLVAGSPWRGVYATGIVDGEPVAEGSAADNYLDGVISTYQDTFTFPVRKFSTWSVASTTGAGGVEVRWFQFAK